MIKSPRMRLPVKLWLLGVTMLLLVSLPGPVRAQLYTSQDQQPRERILLNDQSYRVEAHKMARMTIDYDLTCPGAERACFYLYELPLDEGSNRPLLSWAYPTVKGHYRWNVSGLATGVYALSALPLDAEGETIKLKSNILTLVYGGDEAMQAYYKRLAVLSEYGTKPSGFIRLELIGERKYKPDLQLRPKAVVVGPGVEARLKALIPPAEGGLTPAQAFGRCEWSLDGPGQLILLDGNEARYLPPPGVNECVAHIQCRLSRYPDKVEISDVYVTDKPTGADYDDMVKDETTQELVGGGAETLHLGEFESLENLLVDEKFNVPDDNGSGSSGDGKTIVITGKEITTKSASPAQAPSPKKEAAPSVNKGQASGTKAEQSNEEFQEQLRHFLNK